VALYFEEAAPHFVDPDGFAESFVYVPAATGLPLGASGYIFGVRNEVSINDGMEPTTDGRHVTIDFLVADVGDPQRGDLVTRRYNGEQMVVCPPIAADGAGMVRVTLQRPPR
jgi:hypothetical protein